MYLLRKLINDFCGIQSSKNHQQMSECPICYEDIDETRNVVITECRHKFHATCLFRSTQSSGYRCPNCRGTLLAATGPVGATGTGPVGATGTGPVGATGVTGATGATGTAYYDINWHNINAIVRGTPTYRTPVDMSTGYYHNDSSDDSSDDESGFRGG
jgi:hypothetical protein